MKTEVNDPIILPHYFYSCFHTYYIPFLQPFSDILAHRNNKTNYFNSTL